MKKILLVLSGALFLIGANLLGHTDKIIGSLVLLITVILFSTAAIIQTIEQRFPVEANKESVLLKWFPNLSHIAPMKRGDFWATNVGAVVAMAVLGLPIGFLAFEALAKENDLIASVLVILAEMIAYIRIAGHTFKGRLLDAGLGDGAEAVGYGSSYLCLVGAITGNNVVFGFAIFIVSVLFVWVGTRPSQFIHNTPPDFQPDQRVETPRA